MYSKEDRELALMALSEGWTQAEAAGLVGCTRTTVGHWAAGPPAELEALRRRCEELELENAILAGTVEILKKTPAPTLPP